MHQEADTANSIRLTMAPARIRRTTTDMDPVQWNIKKLEQLRGNRFASEEERWITLTIFYGIHNQECETGNSAPTSARARMSTLLGRSTATVDRILTSWVKANRSDTASDCSLRSVFNNVSVPANRNSKPIRGPNAPKVLVSV